MYVRATVKLDVSCRKRCWNLPHWVRVRIKLPVTADDPVGVAVQRASCWMSRLLALASTLAARPGESRDDKTPNQQSLVLRETLMIMKAPDWDDDFDDALEGPAPSSPQGRRQSRFSSIRLDGPQFELAPAAQSKRSAQSTPGGNQHQNSGCDNSSAVG